MHWPRKEPETPKVSDYHSRPKLADYGFGVNVTDLVAAIKDTGDKVK